MGVGASGKSWEQAWVQVSSSLATAHDSALPAEAGEGEKSELVPSICLPPSCRSGETLSGPLCFALLTPSSRQSLKRISPDLTHLVILHLQQHEFADFVQTPYQQCPLDGHVSCLRMRFETVKWRLQDLRLVVRTGRFSPLPDGASAQQRLRLHRRPKACALPCSVCISVARP